MCKCLNYWVEALRVWEARRGRHGRRIEQKPREDRVRYGDLFDSGDRREMVFWQGLQRQGALDGLEGPPVTLSP